jgi:hypothetical protein
MPDAEIVLLEGIGHVPHITQAAFVAERISRFMESSRPLSPVAGDDPLDRRHAQLAAA